jgi:hypothetical protein
VATSLKALTVKEMIVYNQDKWNVYDVFFPRWLEYNFKMQVIAIVQNASGNSQP